VAEATVLSSRGAVIPRLAQRAEGPSQRSQSYKLRCVIPWVRSLAVFAGSGWQPWEWPTWSTSAARSVTKSKN